MYIPDVLDFHQLFSTIPHPCHMALWQSWQPITMKYSIWTHHYWLPSPIMFAGNIDLVVCHICCTDFNVYTFVCSITLCQCEVGHVVVVTISLSILSKPYGVGVRLQSLCGFLGVFVKKVTTCDTCVWPQKCNSAEPSCTMWQLHHREWIPLPANGKARSRSCHYVTTKPTTLPLFNLAVPFKGILMLSECPSL
jgi:hypothetical protein